MSSLHFTKDQILKLLEQLEGILRLRGIEGKIFIVGGAAMALAYNAGRSTGDIDGIFRPRQEILDAASEVGEKNGFAKNYRWLSDGVKQLHMPPQQDEYPHTIKIGPSLTVEIASAEYILAMKAMSSRFSDGDLNDAAILCVQLNFRTEKQIEDTVRRYFGKTDRFGAQELWFERIIETSSSMLER